MRVKGTAGFTLIELMIAVTIVAILAAVAYPSYTSYVAQSRRTDAQIALSRVAALQEKFFTVCSSYTSNLTAAFPTAGGAACAGAGLAYGTTSPDGHYSLAVAAGATGSIASSFAATATATGPQATADGAKCTSITLTSTGTKSAVGSLGTGCWKK